MESSKSIQFFENLMSPNKDLRTQAESDLEQLKQKPFNETFPIFKEGISYPEPLVGQFATLILKKVYLDNDDIKKQLSKENIEEMKNFICAQIDKNINDWKYLKRLGEVLAKIYQLIKDQNYFGEIMQLFNQKTAFLARKLALFIISNLSDLYVIDDELAKNNNKDFYTIFELGIKDEKDEVKTSAIIAFNKFIGNLKEETVRELFISLIDTLLFNILSLFKEKTIIEREIFDTLIFLVDTYPKFFINNMDSLIDFVSKISLEKKIEFHIRTSSLEIIYSLAHSMPAKLRENKKYKEVFLPLIFQLILELDNINSLDKWEKLKEDDENDLEFMFYQLKNGIERISLDLGGEFFFNSINNLVDNYLNSKNWIEIHGGLAALAYISESAKDIFSKNIKELLGFISNNLVHEHPRVRYMALVLLSNLLRETAPKPQKDYINVILPGLAKLLTSEGYIRVKSMACFALRNFFEGLYNKNKKANNNIDILNPYLNELIQLIKGLLEESIKINYEPLQKNSLDCISFLSNIYEKNFGEHYPDIMSGLKKLYYNIDAKTSAQKQLKSNCITTIGYLFNGIGEDYEKYKSDFIELSNAFLNDLGKLPEEDPQILAIIEAFINITFGIDFNDFKDIFDKLYNYLEKYISADIGLTFQDAAMDEYVANKEEVKPGVGSVVFNMGAFSKKLSVNTFALQLKIVSFEALNHMALNLEEYFKNYIERYIESSKKLLTFAYSRKIRKIAFKSIYICTNACTTDDERKKVFELIINDLLGMLEFDIKSGYFKDMKCIIKYIGKSINLFKSEPQINSEIVNNLFSIIKNVLTTVKEKIISLYNLFINDKDGIYDDNDRSDQNSDIMQLQKIYKYINILYSGFHNLSEYSFVKLAKENLLEFYTKFWDEELDYLLKNKENKNIKNSIREVHENSIALCINFYNIFLEYSDNETFRKYSLEYFPKTQKIEESEKILSEVASGYGIIFERQDNSIFKEKFSNSFTFIQKILERNITDENAITYDRAIRSFGKYIYYKCYNDEIGYNLALKFVKLIPPIHDLAESEKVCVEFLDQINEERNNILLQEEIKEETKNAVNRIIQLNQQENFIDDFTKILKACMTLELNFSHLVD